MSYAAIKERLGIPRSTLSKWFKNSGWSNQIAIDCIRKAEDNSRIRLSVLNVVKRGRLESLRKDARQEALLDFEEIKYHPLFVAGLIAYWMHGDMKSRNRVCFSSADPQKVALFKKFLIDICNIEQFSVWISLKRGNISYLAESFWSSRLGVPKVSFGKTVLTGRAANSFVPIRDIDGSVRAQKFVMVGNNHGVCNLVVNSAYLKSKIVKWLELILQDLNAGIV